MTNIKDQFRELGAIATSSTDAVWKEAKQLGLPHPVWDGSKVVDIDPFTNAPVSAVASRNEDLPDASMADFPFPVAAPKAEEA